MCATNTSAADVDALYNLFLSAKPHLMISDNVSQDGRIRKKDIRPFHLSQSESFSDLHPLLCTLSLGSLHIFFVFFHGVEVWALRWPWAELDCVSCEP